MQQRLKQRLIGAAVLTALAVIFLPMLLTGPVEQRRVDVPIEVPPRPEVTPSAELPDAGFAEQPAPGQDLAEQPPQRPEQQPEPQTEPTTSPNEPMASAQAPPDSSEAQMPESEPVTPGALASSSASGSQSASVDEAEASPPEEEGNWAVQVGGFRGSDNAQRLRDRLRDAGFTVYVDETQLDGEPLYRVKLGPVLERAEAEALAQRVEDELAIKGLVIAR